MKAIFEKKINGRSCTVNQFPAFRGWRIFTKLSRYILPSLASAAGSVKNWENLEIEGDALASAVRTLFTELDADKSEELLRELLELTWVEGKEVIPQFDILFQGEYGFLVKLIGFVVEVNYKSFLGENGFGILKEKMNIQTEAA